MATQKVPLTRIDPTGASEGKVLKYSSGALAWGDDDSSGGGGGGGDGTAFKNTILGTESVSANSLEQYQVHSGLEILSGGSFTISLSGDLVLDAPDDPHKAAGWTDSGNVIHTTDSLNKVVIGQTTALSADDMLSVAGGNVTVAGSISAQGDVYGNARTMTNPGVILQVKQFVLTDVDWSSTSTSYINTPLSGTITPTSANSKIIVAVDANAYGDPGFSIRYTRTVDGVTTALVVSDSSANAPAAMIHAAPWHGATYHTNNVHYSYIDSPATTSEIRYQVQAYTYQNTMYLNRTGSTAAYATHGTSQITLMEVSDATTGVITTG